MALKRPQSKGTKSRGGGLGKSEANLEKAKQSRYKKTDWLKFVNDTPFLVRVVDTSEGFKEGFVHPVEFEPSKGKSFTRDVMCLDQNSEGDPCPGCRDDLERRYKYWLVVIERELEEDDDGDLTPTGKNLGVKLFGGTSARLIKGLNAKHKRKNLDERDIVITRTGEKFDTQYEVEWSEFDSADNELTKKELEAVTESGVYDALTKYTTIPEFDEFYELDDQDENEEEDQGQKSQRRGASFKTAKTAAKRAVADDDDDEDEDDEEDDPPVKKVGGLAGVKGKKTTSKLRRS